MNGLTIVPTTKLFSRVHLIKVITAGTSGSNTGTITATSAVSAFLQGQIEPLLNQMLGTHFTIPRNHILLLQDIFLQAGGGDEIAINLETRPLNQVFHSGITLRAHPSGTNAPLTLKRVLEPLTDIKFSGARISGSGTQFCSIGYSGYLVRIDGQQGVA